MNKPTLKLSREMWDEIGAADRAELQSKYDVVVNKFYYQEAH